MKSPERRSREQSADARRLAEGLKERVGAGTTAPERNSASPPSRDWFSTAINTETVTEALISAGAGDGESVTAKEFEKRIDRLLFLLVEDWCLCRYCQLFDPANPGRVHWANELKIWIESFKSMEIKRGVDKRGKLRRTLVDGYDCDDPEKIRYFIRSKFDYERISDKSRRTKVATDFASGVNDLIDAISLDSVCADSYIRDTFGVRPVAGAAALESPLEVTTIDWPVFDGVRYRVSVDGIRAGDCRIPHIHLDRADDLERKEFSFEISLTALLSIGEPALVRQKDASTRVDRVGEDCNWKGCERLRDGVLAYLEAAPGAFAPRGSRSKLESVVILWNKECGPNPNRLAEYLAEHRIEVLEKYRCFFPTIYPPT